MTPPMVLMLILSFLMLVTSFVVSFREPTERLVHVGLTTLLLIYFAVSTMWPVVFEGDRVIANPLPRVVTASLSAALRPRLFIRQWRVRRQRT